MNLIAIHGRLTKPPDMRSTMTGKAVCNFTVAVSRKFAPKGEEKQTDFFDCVAWGKTGEVIGKYFTKGSEVVVSGRMESRKWEDKNGNVRTSWEIQVQEFDFCGSRSDKTQGAMASDDFMEVDLDSGDLPF